MPSETDLKILKKHISIAQSTHFSEDKPNKKRKKNLKPQQDEGLQKQHFKLKKISPLTENQKLGFSAWANGDNLMLHGLAGTGKSFISLYLAFKELFQNNSYYKNIVIIRSVVPTRDMGFLPGNLKEKAKVYELPYQSICTELFDRGDSYELLKTKRVVDFMTTSFIRGNTFHDSIIIVDEVNNMTFHELDSVITRLGNNCRIIMCGDYRQSDLKTHEKDGLLTFMSVVNKMSAFYHIDFGIDDIVRSGLVKEYIIAKNELGLT